MENKAENKIVNPEHIVMSFEAYEKTLNFLSSFEYKVVAQVISEVVTDVNTCSQTHAVCVQGKEEKSNSKLEILPDVEN